MTAPALLAENLSKTYKRSHLGRVSSTRGVVDVSFTVAGGEVFGLLGLNGSGKTTTIKLLLGLLFPTKGEVRVLDQPAGSRASQRKIGYLPEVPYFYKYLTAREILDFYGRVSGMKAETIPARREAVLDTVRLASEARSRPMGDFSKGMLQRVGLAQALLHDPPVLVFDEPVTGLDPLGLREMRQLISDLNKAGKTIFFSSHSISEVERLCRRVGILVDGRLARVIAQKDWSEGGRNLEDMFVETVLKGRDEPVS